MSFFHFDSAASAREAERVLHDAGLRQDEERPVFGGRLQDGSAKVLFANQAMLALFETSDLASLSRRLFTAGDPGSKRLVALVTPGSRPRLERLRFYAHGRIFSYTFHVLWPKGDAESPLLLASILDAPSFAGRSEPEAVPARLQAEEEACEPQQAKPAEAVPSAAPSETAAAFPDARPVRFLWRTDAEDRFVEITPPLAEIVGEGPASLIGKSLAEVREGLGIDYEGRLTEAFAKRSTWSGIEVLWPIAGTQRRVPVGLGALPGCDAQRIFEGFHGFGVIYGHRAVETNDPIWRGWPLEVSKSEAPDAVSESPSEETLANEVSEATASESLAGADLPWGSEGGEPALDVPFAENVIMLRPIVERLRQALVKENPPAKIEPPAAANDLSSEEQDAFQEIARALSDDIDGAASDEASIFDAPDDEKPEAPVENPVASEELREDSVSASETAEAVDAGPAASEDAPEKMTFVATRETVAVDPITQNAPALFEVMQAAIAVYRNEEPVFANSILLKLMGQPDLEAARQSGVLASLLAQASSEKPKLVAFIGSGGETKQLIAHEQCVDWEGAPATVLVLQPLLEQQGNKNGDYERESLELNAILDTATDGVAVIDAKGRILTLNRSGEALFGYDQNDVAGEPFSILFHAESKIVAEDYLEGLKTHGVKSLLNDGREVVGRVHQGGLIPIFMTLGCVSGSDVAEKDLKFCALLRDMTHWKKVEQELDQARKEAERASALKSDFLAKVSHEIRTPLNAILGFAEVIMDERFGPIGNERYKDYLKDIHMSGAHVMSLVNDLLDLSKIEAGKLELNFQEIDANKIISECVALMQPQANRERVIMRMSLSPQLPRISADERSLRQIILNLLSNAVKFNEPGGQVIIATVAHGSGHAILRIKDTGIGMSEDDIGFALEPFHQLTTTRQTIGTGLGLPLTKALVEANHAFFSIKSKKQEGTLVEVTFPVVQVSA